jgi:hypothetical protein
LLTVENHQLGHSLGIANCLLVIGDGLLGLGDRDVLIPEDVRPKPPINDFLIRFQHVSAQTKAGMEKHLIVLVRTVETPDQVEQRCTVKIREFCFDIGPDGVRF